MNNCIPQRSSSTGAIDRYICDDSKSKKNGDNSLNMTATLKDAKPQNFEMLGKMKSTGMSKTDPNEKYDNNEKAIDFFNQLDAKIKSCLSNVYSAQAAYQKINGEYTSDHAKLGLKNIAICNGLDLLTEVITASLFKTVAKRGTLSWSVDSEKNMTKLY